MKIIVEAPRGRGRDNQIAKLITTALPRSATLIFDPLDPRKCREPPTHDWMICVDPEFAGLPNSVRCAADRVYRQEGVDSWRELRYVS